MTKFRRQRHWQRTKWEFRGAEDTVKHFCPIVFAQLLEIVIGKIYQFHIIYIEVED